MRITINEGQVQVIWNDRGDRSDPPVIIAENLTYHLNEEQTLRDLHQCLDFLFGKPKHSH